MNIRSDLKKKVILYSLAGAAVTTAGLNFADAEIVDTTFISADHRLEFSGDSFDIDVDENGTIDFTFDWVASFDGLAPASSELITATGAGNNLIGSEGTFALFADNTRFYVDASAPFSNGTTQSGIVFVTNGSNPINRNFFQGYRAYIGLEFEDTLGNTYFGAAFRNVDEDDGFLTMNFQWENVAGRAWGAAAVPEPSAIALLAMGAVGLAARRRRRKSA